MRPNSALLLLLLGGCGGRPTSLDVTVGFDDGAFRPELLQVTLDVEGGALVTMRTEVRAIERGRAVRSGDDFIVLLPDTLDGRTVIVRVEAPTTLLTLRGEARALVVRGQRSPVRLSLDPPRDGGVMDRPPPVDLAPRPDAACIVGCRSGVQTSCDPDGTPIVRPCGFGCRAQACAVPDNCQIAADVTAGLYSDTTAGFNANTRGSCVNSAGPDAVTRLKLGTWSTVTYDTVGSAFDTVLYTRTNCGDPFSEIPLAGPCPGAYTLPGRTSCNDDAPPLASGASKLVECGLPPGAYYTWIDAKGSESGPYKLRVGVTPVGLNDCDEAGNLLEGGTFNATTIGHANRHASQGQMGCAGDRGDTSPEAVFFFSLNATRDIALSTAGTAFGHSLYVRRDSCAGPDLACDLGVGRAALVTLQGATAGLYFVFVDGAGGQSGPLTITLTER